MSGYAPTSGYAPGLHGYPKISWACEQQLSHLAHPIEVNNKVSHLAPAAHVDLHACEQPLSHLVPPIELEVNSKVSHLAPQLRAK